MLANSLVELDRRHLVHPLSSFRGHEARGVRVMRSAQGARVTDNEGHELIDGFAGLWCVNAGYGQESVVEAAAAQMRELPYATGYFNLGAEAPIRLAAELAERAPGDLDHVYFSLGGSDAVDSAVRFIRYYWHAQGKPERDQFISVAQGFHGSTSAGAGLTALPVFHEGFGVPYDWQHKIPSHYAYRNPVGSDEAGIIAASTAALRAKAEELGPERVAAFFVEPIQGSGGVLVPPKGWIKAMREVCTELGILFVADEVITGFGRTGPLFASEEEGIVPDLMTVAKGLTSGYAPMGAVFMRDHVYQTIAEGAGQKLIGHGFTYSGHPVSAAVGLEVLKLYEGGLLENGRRQGARLQAGLAGLSDHPLVGDVRGRGMLAAVELVTDKDKKTPLPAAALEGGTRLFDRAYDNGLIVRAFAQGILGFAPPLCCTDAEIDQIIERTRRVLDLTLEDPEIREVMRA
ncbi:aspartate aminotransferase family protein [Roseovarius atlanticus]|uniref:aspartate aminotransferase family protein n=1 Tax=Roseovarius atlanticus TaxID=1641875 RepID=UPI001C96814A|nr:aspartate aminotransferase family protein [Roseovarius atlanticus]MBY5987752.1 aspartate aminotransferase family protein [Roseovarius atlanticus]MBY6123143.1 aspartate aminotransferase family protein [Roseovarius atlanticus]MBY6147639.1 aspartate aminotransferase family protein [Roseovarius atlanticus]